MKTRIILSVLLVTILFTGCKNEEKGKPNEEPNEEAVLSKNVIVTLDLTIKKDDDLQVYYTDKTSTDFNEKESIWQHVKGSEVPQKVVFNLPEDAFPTMVRIDFGVNKDQEDIILSGVGFEYLGKNFIVNSGLLPNYFRPQTETNIDFNTGIIKAIVKDGKRVEPALFPHEVPLSKELVKLIQQ